MLLGNRGNLTERRPHCLVRHAHRGRDLAQGTSSASKGSHEVEALAVQLPVTRFTFGVPAGAADASALGDRRYPQGAWRNQERGCLSAERIPVEPAISPLTTQHRLAAKAQQFDRFDSSRMPWPSAK